MLLKKNWVLVFSFMYLVLVGVMDKSLYQYLMEEKCSQILIYERKGWKKATLEAQIE